MSLSQNTQKGINEFLNHSKIQMINYKSTDNGNFTIVIGNQAGDADSVISALVWAFLSSLLPEKCSTTFIPVICGTRKDYLSSHPLEVMVLKKSGIDIASLCFLEEVEKKMNLLDKDGRLQLILVDHNKLAPDLHARFSNNVIQIVDHHADQCCYKHVEGALRNISFDSVTGKAGVNKACETVLVHRGAIKDGVVQVDIVKLLCWIIIVDTINFNETVGKATELDKTVYAKLKHICGVTDEEFTFDFNSFAAAKFDRDFWLSCSTSQCLGADYKQFEVNTKQMIETKECIRECIPKEDVTQKIQKIQYGTSSCFLTLDDMVISAGGTSTFLSLCSEFIKKRNIKFLVIFSQATDNSVPNSPVGGKRQILITSKNEYLLKVLGETILDETNKLELDCIDLSKKLNSVSKETGLCVLAWNQKNMKYSRKRTTPIIDSCFSSI